MCVVHHKMTVTGFERVLLERHIEGATRIKVRATGDAVRVIPKTHALGVITKVEVFAVPECWSFV